MELRPDLFVQTRQCISITPRVIQSIKLLKFGHEELWAYLKEQEERNPLIEVLLPEATLEQGADLESKRGPDAGLLPRDSDARASSLGAVPTVETSAPRVRGTRFDLPGGDLRSIEETCSSAITLREHLLQQVDLTIVDRVDRLIAVELVESIEPDGYLRRDLEEIADYLGIVGDRVESVLTRVQSFEPTGVGARDLAECLRLQLEEVGRLSPAMALLLDNLEMLANYDMAALAGACGVGQKEIVEMVRKIRKLDPRPGERFDNEAVLPALPDVKVKVGEDGSCHVELNSAILPKILVDREYYAEMRAVSTGAEETRFVTDCMKDANWLTRNLDLRANTLLRVATEIVKRQKDFLLKGVEHIRPLCQGDVADALGLHRSTVCRAISGKYMITSRGMFELKYFFSNALQSTCGTDKFSAESIRARIRHLIEEEPASKVMSDDAITGVLHEDGVEIARRTVAKYREMMGIPSSSIRRRRSRTAHFEARAGMA